MGMNEEKRLDDTGTMEVLIDGDPTLNVETTVLEKMTDVPEEDTKTSKQDEEEEEESSALKEVLLFFKDLAISFAVVLILVNFIIRPIQVKGSSMYPTLKDGEVGFSNLIGRKTTGIERFDIVIVYMEDKDEYLVKRCVGLPNETIAYKDGILYVDGKAVEEEFLDEEYKSSFGEIFTDDVEEITLGDDEYFCVGDNRPRSTDSRYYGPFTEDMIISKGVFILFPFSNFGVKSW